MKRRLFIAIPFPEEIKVALEKKLKSLRDLFPDARFVPPQNWHITLVFLGYQDEEKISAIKRAMEEISQPAKILVEFDKIVYGPIGPTKRMIWLTVKPETSKKIGLLKKYLEDRLQKVIDWQKEKRLFRGHVTIARFENRPTGSLPKIEGKFAKTFEFCTINLMESILTRSGAIYRVLHTAPLKQFNEL